jgi:hypothetical protein
MKAFLSSACVAGVLMVGADVGSIANPWNNAKNFASHFAFGAQAASFDPMSYGLFAQAPSFFDVNANHFFQAWLGRPDAQNTEHFAISAAFANAQIVAQPIQAAGFVHNAFEVFFS